MRPTEEDGTRALLSTLVWRPVDTEIAQEARALARQWLPSRHAIDSADLAIAATAARTSARLLMRKMASGRAKLQVPDMVDADGPSSAGQ